MPEFRYTIHTHGGQVLSDTMMSDSEQSARYELENLGNTVLSITEISGSGRRVRRVFAFEGTDARGQRVSGKVKTVDEPTARTKLEREHGLSDVRLEELQAPKPETTSEERQALIQEAQAVLSKAGAMLGSLDARDPRYLKVSTIQARLNEMIANDDVDALRNETPELLSDLQEIEHEDVEALGQAGREEVVVSTEQLIAQVKQEAERLKRDPRFLRLNGILTEALILSRWLLTFYAAYFAFAEVATAKRLNLPFADFLSNSISSALLYKVALAVLVVNLFARIKLSLLESTFVPALILSGVTGLLVISLFLI